MGKNNLVRVLNSEIVASSSGSNTNRFETVRFGVFELDLRTRELRRNGTRVKLQEQPFQVLAQLLENPGAVVSRDDLRERLWPADTFVDFDHSLNAAIRRLRDALGDSAENPIFVETVARRGYRFLAPITTSPKPDEHKLIAVAKPNTKSHGSHLRGRIGASVAAILLVLVGLKLGLLLAREHLRPQAHISQLTANPEEDRIRTAAISRDGKYLAFSDERGFYLRQIDTGETHSVVLPENLKVVSMSWFPDNVHIVVALSASEQHSSLWELSTLGGQPRKILEDGQSPAVSPNGKEVAYILGSKLHQQVSVIQADGTQSRKVVGDEGDLFGSLAWSPDGANLACTRTRLANGAGMKAAIEVFQVHQGSARSPVQFDSWALLGLEKPLAWAPDGHLIYTMAEKPPNPSDSNLWSVEVNAQGKRLGIPVRLTGDAGGVFSISITADGKRITYVKGVTQPDVYVAQIKGPAIINEPQRITLDDYKEIPYDWTADGNSVIFVSDRTGTLSVYKQAIDQTVPDLLVRSSHPLVESRLSPDSTQLLYLEIPNWGETGSESRLMRAPLVGGAPQKVLAANWITNHQCARAPGTICIYSVVKDRSLTFFTFDPFKGKGTQVLRIADNFPQFFNWTLSPDGSTLAIVKAKIEEQPRIHLVSLHGAPEKWLRVKGSSGLASLDWAADSKSLWSVSTGEDENRLLNIDLQGHIRAVWQPKRKTVGWAIPSRDGQSLALNVGSTTANAWMLDRP